MKMGESFDPDKLWCSTMELTLPHPNYTVNLVKHFKEQTSNPLAVVVGGDCLSQLHTWERWDEIPELAKIVAIGRPGYNTECKLSNVLFYPVGISTVSSSEVRNRISNNESLDGFVPYKVRDYIKQNGLYAK